MTEKTYDIAKFCAKCNETIFSNVYFKCENCAKIKYYLCEACERQGKFRFHAEGKHKLIEYPIFISAPKNVKSHVNVGHSVSDFGGRDR